MKLKGIRFNVQTGEEIEFEEEIPDEEYQKQLKQSQAQEKMFAFQRLLEDEKRRLLEEQVWNKLLNQQ